MNTRLNIWLAGSPNLLLAYSLAASLSALGCSKPKEKTEAAKTEPTTHGLTAEQAALPLVKIADETVTVGEFANTIAEKSPYLRARYTSPERRRELLDELVKFELLAREAKQRGLDKAPEVERARRQVMVQQMMKSEFEDKVKLGDVNDAEVKAYYDAHPDEFHKPAQVRASQILVKDEAKAKKLLKQLQEKAQDNEFFREQVRTQSDDAEGKKHDGDLSFFSAPKERVEGDPEVPDAVAEAAFTLEKVGDLYAEPVKSPLGYHILKLTGKRKALNRTLEQAQRTVQNKLWREKREAAVAAFMKDLREKAKVEENWALLDQVEVPAAPPGATPAKPTPPAKGAPRTMLPPPRPTP